MPLTSQQRGAYIRCLIKRGLIEKDAAKELKDDEILKMSEPFRKKKTVQVPPDSDSEQEQPMPIPKKKSKEMLSVTDLKEFVRMEVENALSEIDLSELVVQTKQKDSGGYSNMLYMLVFQALIKLAPPLIESILSSAKNGNPPAIIQPQNQSNLPSSGPTLDALSQHMQQLPASSLFQSGLPSSGLSL